MKMAFDIHGTIGTSPFIFIPIMKTYVSAGIEVCIISGPPEEQIRQELFDLNYFEGIHFNNDGVYSVVDYIKQETNVQMEQNPNGSWYCDEDLWWKTKGSMCDHYNIDMITDNDLRYKGNMPERTTFIHWNI